MMIVFCHMECTFLGLHSRLLMPWHQASDSPQPGINKMSFYTHFQNQGSRRVGFSDKGECLRVSLEPAVLPGQPNGSCTSTCWGSAHWCSKNSLASWWHLGDQRGLQSIWAMATTVAGHFPIGHFETYVQFCERAFNGDCSDIFHDSITQQGKAVVKSLLDDGSQTLRRDHLLFKDRCDVEVTDLSHLLVSTLHSPIIASCLLKNILIKG